MFRRRLKANHGTEAPANIICFDCETKQHSITEDNDIIAQRFWFGFATYFRIERGKKTRRDSIQFTDPMQFWAWVESKQQARNPLWVFAHNAHFDLTVSHFFEVLSRGDYTLGPVDPNDGTGRVRGKKPWRGFCVTNRSPYFWKLMGRVGRVNFVDSYNYCQSSLERIGNSLGVPKMPFPGYEASWEEWIRYCQNDVQILEELIFSLVENWKRIDGGVWQMTSAGLSVHAWRHHRETRGGRAFAPDVVFDHNERIDTLEREGYFGGFTGAFFRGRILDRHPREDDFHDGPKGEAHNTLYGPIYGVDVRSLYPAMMLGNLFPRARHEFRERPTPEEVRKGIQGRGGMARVRISSWTEEFPVRNNDVLIYATGSYWTTLCGPELARALETNSVTEVEWVQYYSVSKIFRNFVDKFWNLRYEAEREGQSHLSLFAKTILNSLSGKFAQHPGRWIRSESIPAMMPFGEWYEIGLQRVRRGRSNALPRECSPRDSRGEKADFLLCKSINWETFVWEDGGTSEYGFPAISAFITSYGREFMREVRNNLPKKSVLYQATDSLLLTEPGFRRLKKLGYLSGEELGFFKLDGVAPDGEIRGCNWYRFGDSLTRSGYWGRAMETTEGEHIAEVWETAESHLKDTPLPEIKVRKVKLTHSEPTNKFAYGEDGFGDFIQLIDDPDWVNQSRHKMEDQEEIKKRKKPKKKK